MDSTGPTTPNQHTRTLSNTLRSFLYAPTAAQIPGAWSDTLLRTGGSRALGAPGGTGGEGPATTVGAQASGKGKKRMGIPFFGEQFNGELPEQPTDGVRRKEEAVEKTSATSSEQESKLSDLAEMIIYQAGTDGQDPPGPLIVIAPVYLPPPDQHDHYRLFEKLRLRLEAFAALGSYSVILLPSPTPHPPTTSLLISSFLALPRLTRKNVRKIWVVGGGWWVRVILTLFSTTLLSGKTAKRRKIVQCSSLSELAREMGPENFVRVEFPPEVYIENSATESSITLPLSTKLPPPMFGPSLTSLMGSEGELGLPRVVKDCLGVLETEGPSSIGVFRRSPSSAMVKQLEAAYNRGHPVTLRDYPDSAYIAASLLKLFLRSLPTPLFPSSAFPAIRSCPFPSSSPIITSTNTPVKHVRNRVLPALPLHSSLLLQPIVRVLNLISLQSTTNLMDVNNLVICCCASMFGSAVSMEEEMEMSRVPGTSRGVVPGGKSMKGSNTVAGVLKVMIESYHEIFDDLDLSQIDPIIRAPLVERSTSASSMQGFFSIPEEEDGTSTSAPVAIPGGTGSASSSCPPSSSSSPLSRSMSLSRSPPQQLFQSPSLSPVKSRSRSQSRSGERRGSGSGAETIGFGARTLRGRTSKSEVTAGEGIKGLFVNSGSVDSGNE
ncbi:Rho GTPase activation protein [Meredithblackwellia eburnea MCA 4105]